MNFREKFEKISKIYEDIDIYVIQECENPRKYDYENIYPNYIWIGETPYKGLGIFAKEEIDLTQISIDFDCRYFIPVRVNNLFTLLGVWSCPDYKNVQLRHHPEEILKYYDKNRNLFDENLVMCGDINCDIALKDEHAEKFKQIISNLEDDNLLDIYHYLNKEEEGNESQATFYPNNSEKTFHLDHVFANPEKIKDLKVLGEKWLESSDHRPIFFEIDESKFL